MTIPAGKLHWSELIEPMFGFAPGEFAGTYEAFLNCIHPEDRQRVIDAVEASVQHQRDYVIEHRIVWPDGTVRWVSESGEVYRDEHGNPVRMFGIVQDITERKQAEEALIHAKTEAENANRAKEQFIAVLSHELRTPLTPVLATVTTLEEQADLPAELRRDMELVHRNVEMEAALIDDLLDVTKINSGKLEHFNILCT